MDSGPPASAISTARALRIDHVTVVDPSDGLSRPDMSVLIRDGRILSVTDFEGADTPAGVQLIDGTGRFAVPGYNNMHTHVLQEKRTSLYMATMLAEGTTGMRQMAGSDDMLLRRRQGRLPLDRNSPRLLALPGALLLPFNAPTVKRVRKEISRQQDLGADFIKLIKVEREVFFEAVTWAHGKGLKIVGHLPPSVSPREASEAGYDCLEHLGTSTNIWVETSGDRNAFLRRQDTSGPLPNWLGYVPFSQRIFTSRIATNVTAKMLINPALMNSPKTVALLQSALDSFDKDAAQNLVETFARNNSWQTPTLVRLRTQFRADASEYENHPWLKMMSAQARTHFQQAQAKFLALPAATRSTYHQYYDMTLEMINRMHIAGVPIMTGTDGPGGNPGQDLQAEFREMAAAGLEPLDILRSTTIVPAAFLRESDRMGTVAPGKNADILLLEADPLRDVENLGKISAIVRDGHFISRQAIDLTVNDFCS